MLLGMCMYCYATCMPNNFLQICLNLFDRSDILLIKHSFCNPRVFAFYVLNNTLLERVLFETVSLSISLQEIVFSVLTFTVCILLVYKMFCGR